MDGFHIVRCAQCDLTYVAESVDPAFLKQYYGEAYYTGAQHKGYADYIGQRESRKRHFRSLIPRIKHHLDMECPRVLDVGCAAGFFLEVVREHGWSGRGVELSTFAAEYARSRLGLDVIIGTLAEAALPAASFDLVTLWDVVEHLPNPRAALEETWRLLRPAGILCVSTGDISGVTARIYGAKWGLLAPPGHLFYFSRRTLFALLRESGFEVLQWQSDGAFLLNGGDVPGAAVSARSLPGVVVALHHNRWINALLRRLRLGSIITVYARRCGA
jgi:2-polyprenyl-3-methyl-5-hydroxy-6-metoxy-1,4-benzoquinol methylase